MRKPSIPPHQSYVTAVALALLFALAPAAAFAGYPEILYYTFNEGSGNQTENLADPGQGSSFGQFVNNPTWVSSGMFGYAINTANGHVDTGWNTELNQSFTIEMWLRTNHTGTWDYFCGDSSMSSFRMMSQNNGVVHVRGGGFTNLSSSAFGSNNGQWFHFAFVYDASTNETFLYVDGNLEDSNTGQSPNTGTSTSTLEVGSRGFGNFSGDIDEFRLWGQARSQSDIQATMNSELGELVFEDLATNETYPVSGATADIGSFEPNVTDSVTFRASSAIPTASIDITSINIANDVNVSNLNVSPSSATGISNTNSEDFVVDFEPDASGPFSFTLEFNHNGTISPSPFELNVEGHAGPQVTVEDGSGEVVEDGETWTPDGAFASQQPSTLTFEIHSTGSDDLDVSQISTTNPSNVVVNSVNPSSFTGGNEITAGTHSTVSVAFEPQGPGTFEFDVVIDSNDAASPYTFTVNDGAVFGTGIVTIDNDPAASPNFTDIGDAIQALHAYGMTGQVIFEIYDDGSGYESTSDYMFEEIPGAGGANTITFRAASGHTPRIIGAGGPTNRTFTFDPFAGIAFQNGATNITLRGLEFDVDGDGHAVTFYSSSTAEPIENIVLDGCRFHSADGAAFASYGLSNRLRDVTVRNSWFWNNEGNDKGTSSFTYSQGTIYAYRTENLVFEHNTIHVSSDQPALFYDNWTNRYIARFENNIVVYMGEEYVFFDDRTTDIQFVDGNLYFAPNAAEFHNDYPTFEAWQADGFDVNGLYGDPYLLHPANGDLRIAIDSLAKDNAPSSIVQRDIFGTFRPVGMGPDIGAEEAAPTDPGIGLRTEDGVGPRHGGSVELDKFGENVPLTYTLYVVNERGGTLNLTGLPVVSIADTTNANATIMSQPSTTQLGMGESSAFELEVTATGSLGDIASVELEIESNDPNFPTLEVELTGEIVPPSPRVEILREGGETVTPQIGIDEIETLFPIERDTQITYTIRNAGSAPVDLTGSPLVQFPSYAGLAGSPSLVQTPAQQIGVQGETTFIVRVTPVQTNFSFGIEVPNSDPDLARADYSFAVQGSAGPLPIAALLEDQIDFGRARATEQANERTIYLHNEGSGELEITGLKVIDPSSSWRYVSSTPPLPIYGATIVLDAAGGERDTLELVFEFAPQSQHPDLLEAILEIETNDPNNPLLVVTMTGDAAPPSADDGEGCAIGKAQTTPWLLLLALASLVALRRRFAN